MMGEEKKLSDIAADIVSSRADLNINPDLAEKFVAQLFKAIEDGLVTSYCVNINGLGIFRVLKSVPADRVLFLDKFKRNETKTESKTIDIPEIKSQPENTVLNTTNLLNENTTPSETEEEKANKIETPVASDTFFENQEDLNEDSFAPVEDNEEGEADDFLYEYEIQDKQESRRKKLSRIKIVALLTAIIIGAGILLFLFMYPKAEQTINQVQGAKVPQYTEIENDDTLHFSHTILVESDLDFFTLSQIYYDSDKFWVYIYNANQEDTLNNNPFAIKSGSIIRIPKLEDRLIDKDNKESLDSAKILSNEISRSRANTFSGN